MIGNKQLLCCVYGDQSEKQSQNICFNIQQADSKHYGPVVKSDIEFTK